MSQMQPKNKKTSSYEIFQIRFNLTAECFAKIKTYDLTKKFYSLLIKKFLK